MKGDHIIAQLRTLLNPSRAAAIVPGIGRAATNATCKQFDTQFLVRNSEINAMLDIEGHGITLLPRDGDDALLITTRRVPPGGSIEQPMLARRTL